MKIVDDVENGIFSRYLKCSCDENNVFVHDGAEGDGVEPEHVDVAVGRQLGQQIDHVLQPGVALPDKEWDRLLILRNASQKKLYRQVYIEVLAEIVLLLLFYFQFSILLPDFAVVSQLRVFCTVFPKLFGPLTWI